jgi:hypothetical protein
MEIQQFKKDFFVHLVLQNMIEIQKKNIQAIKNSFNLKNKND